MSFFPINNKEIHLIKNIFYVIATPNANTMAYLINFHKENTDIKIVFGADLNSYFYFLNNYEKKNVRDLPANLRITNKTFTFGNVNVKLNEEKSIQAAQDQLTNSTRSILSFAEKYHIPVLFASLPREKRPIYICTDGEQIYFPETVSTNSSSQSFESEFSKSIYNKIILPAFEKKGIIINTMLNHCEKRTFIVDRKETNVFHASFFPDVLTILYGKFTSNIDYSRYERVANSTKNSIQFSKNLTFKTKYFNDGFVESNLNGHFYKLDDDTPVPRDITNNDGNAFIWHDAYLNDVDDIPAIFLAEKIFKKVDLKCNYK